MEFCGGEREREKKKNGGMYALLRLEFLKMRENRTGGIPRNAIDSILFFKKKKKMNLPNYSYSS